MPMTNQFLSNMATFVFFAVTPLLLGIRFVRPKWMPWLLLLALALIISWGVLFASNDFHFAALKDEINQYESRGENPPEELRERWASDASRVGVLFLGWLFGVVYFLPWLGVYALACVVRRRLSAKPAA